MGSAAGTERFRLAGPSIVLDPDVHAYRSDIADVALAGQLFAPHYASPAMRRVRAGTTLRRGGDAASEALGPVGTDDAFALLDLTAGWAWGYRRSDHRVGYVPEDDLIPA